MNDQQSLQFLRSEIEEHKRKLEVLKQAKETVKSNFAAKKEEIQKYKEKRATYKQSIRRLLIRECLAAESSVQQKTFAENLLHKQNWGQLKNLQRPMEDWVEGAEILRAAHECRELEKRKNELEQLRKEPKRRRKSKDKLDNDQKELIKITLFNIQKQQEECQELFEKAVLEKRKIELFERRLVESSYCLLSEPLFSSNDSEWPLFENRYQILSFLSKGLFGELYKAYDLDTLEFVTVKAHVISSKSDPGFKNRMTEDIERERLILQSLNHQLIPKYIDSFTFKNFKFTVTEYFEGTNLETYVRTQGAFQEKTVRVILKQLLIAVRYLHTHNPKIFHGDIRLGNLIMGKDGMIKLTDFSLAHMCEHGDSVENVLFPVQTQVQLYPPELYNQSGVIHKITLTDKVDMFAVGITLFHLLYGNRFLGSSSGLVRPISYKAIFKGGSTNLPDSPVVSQDLKEMIRKCVTLSPETRIGAVKALQLCSKVN